MWFPTLLGLLTDLTKNKKGVNDLGKPRTWAVSHWPSAPKWIRSESHNLSISLAECLLSKLAHWERINLKELRTFLQFTQFTSQWWCHILCIYLLFLSFHLWLSPSNYKLCEKSEWMMHAVWWTLLILIIYQLTHYHANPGWDTCVHLWHHWHTGTTNVLYAQFSSDGLFRVEWVSRI